MNINKHLKRENIRLQAANERLVIENSRRIDSGAEKYLEIACRAVCKMCASGDELIKFLKKDSDEVISFKHPGKSGLWRCDGEPIRFAFQAAAK